MDLFLVGPLHQVATYSWAQTIRVCSTEFCRNKLLEQGPSIAPPLKSNLHWSIRPPESSVVATPLTWSPLFAAGEQRAEMGWVYRFSIHHQGALIEDRCKAWRRDVKQQRVPRGGEYYMEPMAENNRLYSPRLNTPFCPLVKEEALERMMRPPAQL